MNPAEIPIADEDEDLQYAPNPPVAGPSRPPMLTREDEDRIDAHMTKEWEDNTLGTLHDPNDADVHAHPGGPAPHLNAYSPSRSNGVANQMDLA